MQDEEQAQGTMKTKLPAGTLQGLQGFISISK
jgi:hypothetical protein